jgi:hypothetical protein
MIKALLTTVALATLATETTSMLHDGNPLSKFSRETSHVRGFRPKGSVSTVNIDQSKRRRKCCSFLF